MRGNITQKNGQPAWKGRAKEGWVSLDAFSVASMLSCAMLISQLAVGMVAGPAVVERGASSAKAALLAQLPRDGQPPLAMPFEMIALVEELEAQGVTPATPEFLTLGLNGRWACRALLAPPLEDKPPAPSGCGAVASAAWLRPARSAIRRGPARWSA